MTINGNLSWCKPYELSKGKKRIKVAVNEGEIVSDTTLEDIAKTFDVAPLDRFGDLFNYLEYDSIQIEEMSCSDCPCYRECEVVK